MGTKELDARQIESLLIQIAEHHGRQTNRTVNVPFDPTCQTIYKLHIFMEYGLCPLKEYEGAPWECSPEPELIEVEIVCDEVTRIKVKGSIEFEVMVDDFGDVCKLVIRSGNVENPSFILNRLINEGHWNGIAYEKTLSEEPDPMGCLADYE